LSAKWRRSKRSLKGFDIFKAFNRVRHKGIHRTHRTTSSKTKTHAYPKTYRLPKAYAEKKSKEMEPLIDILDEKDNVIVVAELAGFSKENLRIHVKNQRLTLSAEATDRKYYKSLNLPKRVIPNTIRTTYKNGVLEIQLKKAIEEKPLDKVAG
jgi:HSP20 family molecular chaperone IbpA